MGYAELASTDRQLSGDDAATAWVRAAQEHPGELIGLATGPLTNLALALRKEPALPTLLHRLVIMGGAYDYRGNTTPVAEWNIAVDPEAAAEVFAAWSPSEEVDPQRLPILCGLDVTRQIALTPSILVRLAAAARLDDDRAERRRRAGYPVVGVQSAHSDDRRRDAVLPGVLSRPRPRLPRASARPVGRGGRTGSAACRRPSRPRWTSS